MLNTKKSPTNSPVISSPEDLHNSTPAEVFKLISGMQDEILRLREGMENLQSEANQSIEALIYRNAEVMVLQNTLMICLGGKRKLEKMLKSLKPNIDHYYLLTEDPEREILFPTIPERK